MTIRVLHGDCRDVLKTLPDRSVQMVCTSPPYYGLRDYGTATWEGGDAECSHTFVADAGETSDRKGRSYQQGHIHRNCRCGATRIDSQIGLESSPEAYIAELVAVFREVRRVLRDDGTCWLNIGDSYNNFRVSKGPGQALHGRDNLHGKPAPDSGKRGWSGFKEKDLLMIPASVAIALRSDGWYLRSDTIWHKPNPMPESCTDRPTSSHEHVFLLTKNARYFYNAEAVREESDPAQEEHNRRYAKPYAVFDDKARETRVPGSQNSVGIHSRPGRPGGRNLRNVWTISTKPYSGAHFAVMPPELAETCIKAGTSEHGCCANCGSPWVRVVERGEPDIEHQRMSGGNATGEYHGKSTKNHTAAGVQDASAVKARILASMVEKTTTGWHSSCKCATASSVVPCTILDPFGGAGTTGLVADRLGRSSILIDLNASYTETAISRMIDDCPMFVDIAPAAPEPHTPDMFAEAAE